MSHEASTYPSPTWLPPELQALDLPVTHVLFTEDRAQVTRAGVWNHKGGDVLLGVSGLSPLYVAESLKVALRLPGGAPGPHRVARAALRRRWVAAERPGPELMRELESRARQRKETIKKLDSLLELAIGRMGALRSEREHYLLHLLRNTSRSLLDPTRLAADSERLIERAFQALRRHQELTQEKETANLLLDELRALLEQARPGGDTLHAWLEIAIEGPEGPVEIECKALLPSALWRPSYEAALSTSASRVDWRLFGTVWQRTGEDWKNISLTLSTARSSFGTSLPPLFEDHLSLREKSAEERKRVVATFRDQTIQSTSLAEDPDQGAPGVDDGGETRVWSPTGRFDIPSDGRPHRVLAGSFDVAAQSRLVCMPELSLGIFRRVTLQNASPGPLLAGPVTLLIDGGYIGLGEIPFIAPSEPFDLSFGSQDELVVKMQRDRQIEKRLALADLCWFRTRVELTHTGDQEVELDLSLRLPVSELEGVTVLLDEEKTTRTGLHRDGSTGHLRWTLKLQPAGSTELLMLFRVDKPSNVSLPDPW